MRRSLFAAGLTALALLAACGGGPAPSPGVAGDTVSAQVNQLRAKAGRSAITRTPRLDAVAAGHAGDMARNAYFGHTAPNGTDLMDRLSAGGLRVCHGAENIAWNRGDASDIVAGWMTSPGHRRNILSREATQFGLARSPGADSAGRRYWVMVLARPGC